MKTQQHPPPILHHDNNKNDKIQQGISQIFELPSTLCTELKLPITDYQPGYEHNQQESFSSHNNKHIYLMQLAVKWEEKKLSLLLITITNKK